MEAYRSGHNEAVLKTVCLHGRVSSNLTPSAIKPRFFGAFLDDKGIKYEKNGTVQKRVRPIGLG